MHRKCKQCGQESGGLKYCCDRCKWTWHNNNRTLKHNDIGRCAVCGNAISRWVSPARMKERTTADIYCNRTCAGIGRMGENHPNWAGGRKIDKDGYVLIHMPAHPQSNKSGYVREHRLVMEKKLGRRLRRAEVVHHINDNPSDNRPSNLQLYPSNREHKKDDYKNRRTDKKGKFITKGRRPAK